MMIINKKISAVNFSTALTYKNNVYEKNYLFFSGSENKTGFYEVV